MEPQFVSARDGPWNADSPVSEVHAVLVSWGIKDPAATEYTEKLQLEGYDSVHMLEHLEQEELSSWNFKKPHVKCIIQRISSESFKKCVSEPVTPTNASTSGATESQGWDKARYTTVRKLGEGGFGCTWLVRDTQQSNRELALKEIRCQDLDEANLAIEESSLMMCLRHAQLVCCHRVFLQQVQDDFYKVCIVMTHYGAGDLSKVIERQRKLKEPFGESTVMGWSRAVLEGCAHLHSHDVVHCDLKPANLLVSDDKQSIVIADFGIAKHIENTMRAGKSGDREGTLQYMAPELLQEIDPIFGKCVDVWSFGVVLLEIMTCERPRGILPWCVQPDCEATLLSKLATIPAQYTNRSLKTLLECALRLEPQRRLTVPALLAELEVTPQLRRVLTNPQLLQDQVGEQASEPAQLSPPLQLHLTANKAQFSSSRPQSGPPASPTSPPPLPQSLIGGPPPLPQSHSGRFPSARPPPLRAASPPASQLDKEKKAMIAEEWRERIATLSIGVTAIQPDTSNALVETVIAEMLQLNSCAIEDQLRSGVQMNEDGSLQSWKLDQCSLEVLPECFGAVQTTQDLSLDDNQLTRLPESIGQLVVGGTLSLVSNSLQELPVAFQQVSVGGNVQLSNNPLENADISGFSFPNVQGDVITTKEVPKL